jgi:hypothetical protein
MNRLLACTAIGLCLGLAPALAESPSPGNQLPNEPAMQVPALPSGPSSAPHATQPSMLAPGQSSQAGPQSTGPATPQAQPAPNQTARFLSEQKPDDWLASNIIGQAVVNAQDEKIGSINDLVTDRSGNVQAALIGTGGFLGIGEKKVAVRFEALKLARSDDDKVRVVLNVSKDDLAAAPDFKTLDKQQVVEGANKGDREDRSSRTY